MSDLESGLDELYAAPLHEFTSRRNMLAKQLKGKAAGEVKALKKPNLAAWAVNQLARAHPDEVEHLFKVTDKLRHAQRRVLSGGKATELRAATDERNKVVGRLKKLASKILRDAGHSASAATLDAVGDSFMAVASDDEGAELLRQGRLSRELEPSAFIDVSGLTLVASAPGDKEAGDDEPAAVPDLSRLHDARRMVAEARGAVKEARDAYKAADRTAEKVARAAEEAERQAKAAREEAEFSRRAADARKSDLEEAEQQLAAAQAELKELER